MISESQETEMSDDVQPTEVTQTYNPSVMSKLIHFRFNKEKYAVSCNPSMTVLSALNKSSTFRGIMIKNHDKDVVIQREKFPKAVVNVDFPCILIDEGEVLDVSFIKAGPSLPNSDSNSDHWYATRCKDLVSFNIRTKGGKNIRQMMRNPELKLEFDFVCVPAKRGETLKKALKRDGRFLEVIFTKHCALIDLENEVITERSTPVDHLDGKHLQVIRFDESERFSNKKQPGRQKVSRTRIRVSGSTPSSSQAEHVNTENLTPTRPRFLNTTDVSAVFKTWRKAPQTEALFITLKQQCNYLLNNLKKQRRFKTNKKLIRVEYEKGVQSFSTIKDLKTLMKLSDSVCKIVIDKEPNGTGFVLFNSFVLTCAHVVIDTVAKPLPQKLSKPVKAEFDYEDSRTKQVFKVKEDIVCCLYEVEGNGALLDFALLELGERENPDAADTSTPPALLQDPASLSSPQVTKGICIIGHPDCKVKKMDICSIILDREWERTARDRLNKIPVETLHVISFLSVEDDWNYNHSQITYDTCFFHGASGSPVFNKHCQLTGIHTGGYVYEDEKDQTERSLMEYAFPIGPVIQHIRKRLMETQRHKDLAVLNSLCSDQSSEESSTPATAPQTIPVCSVVNEALTDRLDSTEQQNNLS